MKEKLAFLLVALLIVSACSATVAGKVYVADYGSDSIWVSDSAAGSTASQLASVTGPLDIKIEPATGNLLVTSASSLQVQRINKTTGVVMDSAVLTGGVYPGSLAYGMAFDSAGRLYVADWWNNWSSDKVLRYTYDGATGKYVYDTSILGGPPYYWIQGPSYLTVGPGPNGNECLWISNESVGWVTVYDVILNFWINPRFYVAGDSYHGNNEGIGISPNGRYFYLCNSIYLAGVTKLEIGVDIPTDPPDPNMLGTTVYDDDRTVHGMSIDNSGNIYVALYRGNRVVVLTGADTGTPVYSHDLFYPNLSGPIGVAAEPGPKPVTIGGAKQASDGTLVVLSGAVATAKFRNADGPIGFAVEEADRSLGIRIVSSDSVDPGDDVNIIGAIATVNGERVIDATSGSVTVNTSSNPVPPAVGMSNKSTGGGTHLEQGAVVDDAVTSKMSEGLNNTGLLERIWGTVTATYDTGTYDGYFYIDDGSGLVDGSTHPLTGAPNIGIRCRPAGSGITPNALPTSGYVTVTGVMGVQQVNGVNARYFWTVSWQ